MISTHTQQMPAPTREPRNPFDVDLYSLGGGQAVLAARGAQAEVLLELRVAERSLERGFPPLGARLVTQLRAWAQEMGAAQTAAAHEEFRERRGQESDDRAGISVRARE